MTMTTANKITILRILLVPFFVVELIYYVRTGREVFRVAAISSFLAAAILDGVDGYVARHFHQISELGKVLDPLADKLLLVSAIVTLSLNHGTFLSQIPLWLTGTVLGRDLLILIGMSVIHFMVGDVVVHPRYAGKIATVLQMVVVLLILFKWDSGGGGFWMRSIALGAAIFTGVSGLLYTWDGMKQLGSHPSSLPTRADQEKL
jgi:CDP-diacylglycerol--glycerol-3-phosphate 3-phosphatidyltransferase